MFDNTENNDFWRIIANSPNTATFNDSTKSNSRLRALGAAASTPRIQSTPSVVKHAMETSLLKSNSPLSRLLGQGLCSMPQAGPFDLALTVGAPGHSPSGSISNRSIAFSEAGNVLSDRGNDEGSERGAFRHATWQAGITSKLGIHAAEKVGSCHERRAPEKTNQWVYDTSAEADTAVDQLNNHIGRMLGWNHKGETVKELSLRVLEYAHKHGLFVSLPLSDGRFAIKRIPLSDDKYWTMRREILNRDENGL